MSEIYWITRLDGVNNLFLAIMIVGIIISALGGISYYIFNGQYIYDLSYGNERSSKEYKGYADTCKRIITYSIPITIIGCLVSVFVPTTKEALAIYGIGGTIDYIKQNPTAKKLPDKCIQALDEWVDSWGINEKDSIKK